MATQRSLKEQLYTFLWFCTLLVPISALGIACFLQYMPTPPTLLTWLYFITAIIGHSFVLLVVLNILISPLLLIPYKRIRNISIAFIFSLVTVLLIVDIFVFSIYRFHINWVIVELFLFGKVATIPTNVIYTVLSLILFCCFIYYFIYQYINTHAYSWKRIHLIGLLCLYCCCLLFAQGTHAFATAFSYQPISVITHYIPLYYPLRANSFLVKMGIIDRTSIAQNKSLATHSTGSIRYPLQSIQYTRPDKLYNILVIAVDSLRADTLSPTTMPNTWNFIQNNQGILLQNHHSTGNATRAGIFGLFFGIPATYWHTFLDNQTPPLWITRMQELNYNINILFSASTTHPEFHRTVFASIPKLSPGASGDTKVERDYEITKDCIHLLKEYSTNHAPFFTFVFYDSLHGGGSYPSNYPTIFQTNNNSINYLKLNKDTDPTPLFNKYKNSAHFIDSLIGKILATLEQQQLLETTIIMITSDHGEEMNDNRQGSWGHNGNFTAAQTHVPFALILPKSITLSFPDWNKTNYRTSHEDIAPTFLQTFLGVQSPTDVYSTGLNLFTPPPKERSFFIVASYTKYGIIGKENIIEVTQAGTYEMRTLNNAPLPHHTPDYQKMATTLKTISKFYQ